MACKCLAVTDAKEGYDNDDDGAMASVVVGVEMARMAVYG